MKIKFSDFGRCLICLHNPCDCKKKECNNNMKNKLKEKIGEILYECFFNKKIDKDMIRNGYGEAIPKLLSLIDEEKGVNKRATQWIVGGDTGCSSKTIWAVMMGVIQKYSMTPSDNDDYGRCIRLLQLIPEWIDRLDEVTAQYPDWKEAIEHIKKALVTSSQEK